MARFEDSVKLLMATYLLTKITADDVGEKKAMETLAKWTAGMFQETFGGKKRELGVSGGTLKEVYLWLRAAGEEFGAVYEIEEETPDRIAMRIKSCPVGPACGAAGLDCQKLCMSIVKPIAKTIPAMVNQNIEWNIIEWNPNIMEGCRYELRYKT